MSLPLKGKLKRPNSLQSSPIITTTAAAVVSQRITYTKEKSHEDLREVLRKGSDTIEIERPVEHNINNEKVKNISLNRIISNIKSKRTESLSDRASVKRKGTLSRPERGVPKEFNFFVPDNGQVTFWKALSWTITWWAPKIALEKFLHMHDPAVQQAWREKITLCFLFASACGILGFLTFGLQNTICQHESIIKLEDLEKGVFGQSVIIHGALYTLSEEFLRYHNSLQFFQSNKSTVARQEVVKGNGLIISRMFPVKSEPCSKIIPSAYSIPCKASGISTVKCHDWNTVSKDWDKLRTGYASYAWDDVKNPQRNLIVYKQQVLDLTDYIQGDTAFFGSKTDALIRKHLHKDASVFFANGEMRDVGECLLSLYAAGRIEAYTFGCLVADTFLYISLIAILAVIFVKFFLAIYFDWFISWELGKLRKKKVHRPRTVAMNPLLILRAPEKKPVTRSIFDTTTTNTPDGDLARSRRQSVLPMLHGNESNHTIINHNSIPEIPVNSQTFGDLSPYESEFGEELHTIMLVTCYSEGEDGLRTTMDSLASTYFREDRKLLFIVADGLIVGSGNKKSTPDIILDMVQLDPKWPKDPEPMSYFAIVSGPKRHNMAKVYVAWYQPPGWDRRVPTIIVAKCGTPAEAKEKKPGNRGKRDSQIILMHLFQSIFYNQKMSPLEFDLFTKMHYLMKETPDVFEVILMVDADTKVAPTSLARMVACFARDPMVMGLCGETRIANKAQTWVTAIQVFEYFLSHHLSKAFESIFGGVTCLPGCFCAYRIKAPKQDDVWVPIICHPSIVKLYSENVVDTLHKKNLLLLGEDRFLTNIMLRIFPYRKLIFVPRAYCKTTVPDSFKVLLSQRRRWINSTIHNLFELVLVRELCGTFCLSMQAIIGLELIGTITLPAAICFTFTLCIEAIIQTEKPIIPLLLLAAILGLPAVLICLTTKRLIYVAYMAVYLLALPIWNFVLPVYAFWHFDDFSWGETRKVQGEGKDSGHGGGEGHDSSANDIPLMVWEEWEKERRRKLINEYLEREANGRRFSSLEINVSGPSNAIRVSPVPVVDTPIPSPSLRIDIDSPMIFNDEEEKDVTEEMTRTMDI
ncbi:hypothetical protein HK098_004800 [Nowakowskiella sp. JEL0407]|nr:hypothetical protein HK098_004800 [Nowakowskiella sp. JEL0407]